MCSEIIKIISFHQSVCKMIFCFLTKYSYHLQSTGGGGGGGLSRVSYIHTVFFKQLNLKSIAACTTGTGLVSTSREQSTRVCVALVYVWHTQDKRQTAAQMEIRPQFVLRLERLEVGALATVGVQ